MSTYFQASEVISAAWIIFLLYWIVASRGRKKAERSEPKNVRILHMLFMAAGFVLLFSSDPRFGPLNQRFLPGLFWIQELGIALALVGIAFAIWARRHIGSNWSAEVTIREEHQLIRSGPYGHIRHPIYTGMLIALVGTALAVGKYRAIIALAIFVVGFTKKAKREESLLADQFGPAFEEHKRLTGFFLPRFS